MALAAKVKHFLDSHDVSYRILLHERTSTLKEIASALKIEPKQMIQTVLLKDEIGVVAALLSLEREVNLNEVFEATHRSFHLLTPKEADRFFNDCEPGSHPPFGKPYGIPMILDKNLEELDYVYFEAGCHTAVVQLSMEDFQFLIAGTPAYYFSTSKQKNAPDLSVITNSTDPDTEMKVDFPELPIIAQQVLSVANQNYSEEAVYSLSNLISNDNIVSDHILQCAQHYLKKEEDDTTIASLQEVITKVFGFKTVSHIAVGITAGRTFQVPREGPLGLNTFWRHSLQSAILAKKIAEHIPAQRGINLQLSYLVGLFHNFGYLLLGHLFPHEFRLLNRWMLLNPNTPIEVLEKRLLGMGQAMNVIARGHAHLGAWLMQYWAMPEPIITATRFHHTADYEGPYASYVNLIQLTNQLLKATGLGDGHIGSTDQECLNRLGLTTHCVENCLQELQGEAKVLNRMAKELTN